VRGRKTEVHLKQAGGPGKIFSGARNLGKWGISKKKKKKTDGRASGNVFYQNKTHLR